MIHTSVTEGRSQTWRSSWTPSRSASPTSRTSPCSRTPPAPTSSPAETTTTTNATDTMSSSVCLSFFFSSLLLFHFSLSLCYWMLIADEQRCPGWSSSTRARWRQRRGERLPEWGATACQSGPTQPSTRGPQPPPRPRRTARPPSVSCLPTSSRRAWARLRLDCPTTCTMAASPRVTDSSWTTTCDLAHWCNCDGVIAAAITTVIQTVIMTTGGSFSCRVAAVVMKMMMMMMWFQGIYVQYEEMLSMWLVP